LAEDIRNILPEAVEVASCPDGPLVP
jgi:hypothetical protein